MHRLARLIAILSMLQSRKLLTAQQMADRFEVSIRTIYRDLRTLEEAGIPIGAEAGEGYFLADVFRLPPINITEMEAFAVLIAQKLVQQQADASIKEPFASLADKVANLLPSEQKEKLGALDFKIGPSRNKQSPKEGHLLLLQKAISEYTVLSLKYRSSGGMYSERDIEPLGLYFTLENWVLVAYCRLRQEEREFRLDRILDLQEKGESFPMRIFNLEKYFRKNNSY